MDLESLCVALLTIRPATPPHISCSTPTGHAEEARSRLANIPEDDAETGTNNEPVNSQNILSHTEHGSALIEDGMIQTRNL